ncbi:sodium-dependent transporter [Peptoniphilus sp. oral taxon 386]|uniref:sodium-dependent transporter n=1 Tax=Peptoniphilus sp. oral taxon 386 TaxID=652713 RepID=UPI0001DA9CD1|nr:sodium-dependent transporter [Peptoniphilus sp. oral taxon 386]EFI42676.1 Sodium:neurotransmitter symporter family protein [Peptoniphilus sp. oral taxon 386 str. F0131]
MKDKKNFSSQWGFILACVGSAVGMANVWGFPFRIGSLGGSAFLIAYLIFVAIFSYVGLSAEYAIGRHTGTGTLGSYEYVFKSRGHKKLGKVVGWIPLIGSFCIAVGYSVIVAYVLKALFQSVTGSIMSVDTKAWFESFALTEYSVIPYHLVIVFGVIITLVVGTKGIEKTNKIMMPLFFILFCILAVRVLFLKDSFEGYSFMFRPEWKDLTNPKVWIFAMGQAFFSLSVTGSGMIVYGAYLSKESDIVKSSVNTAFFDTIAAIVASLVIIPACFSYGVDVSSGPGLLFVTLPAILQDIPFGRVFAIVLFLAVVFGGITSLQNMFEVVIESIMYKFPHFKRRNILAVLAISLFAISVNMEAIFIWGPWMDFVSIYIIPIGALLGALTWFWILDPKELLSEINVGSSKKYSSSWHFIGKYIYVPLAAILCFIAVVKGISF